MKTSWEKVTVDGSPMGMYMASPDGNGPYPAILVIQNQDGVREFTQEMTRRVAEAGENLAVILRFDRPQPGAGGGDLARFGHRIQSLFRALRSPTLHAWTLA